MCSTISRGEQEFGSRKDVREHLIKHPTLRVRELSGSELSDLTVCHS